MSIVDIRIGISNEIEATPEYFDFRVRCSQRDGKLWVVTVNGASVFTDGHLANVVLDESFDGANAWWSGPPKGNGQVLTVNSAEEQIVIRHASVTPPGKDEFLRLYPPRYLDALRACWSDGEWAKRAWDCHTSFATPVKCEHNPLAGKPFLWLRQSQRHALKLVGHSPAFLWGPPGTGKTTTVGVLLAEYLYANPRAHVLLLSTTNYAVDQAIIAVDKALEVASRSALRKTIARIGSRFIAAHYHGREHLLPVVDQTLIRRLAETEAARPDTTDLSAYSAWVEGVDSLRKLVREQSLNVLRTVRLAAMTTTRAAFSLADLRLLPAYDLVVFDEASQVGLAHALVLMPLAKVCLFAGDPRQLSPIVRSTQKSAKRWLGNSPFFLKPRDGDSLCFLDEQSRMAEPICALISHVFYGGALKVARKESADPVWHAQRQIAIADIGPSEHVAVCCIPTNGQWSQKYRGPIRFDSAESIVKMIATTAAQGIDVKDHIIVLTPFRAQRSLIKQKLTIAGIRGVKVSTVHRAQGSETSVVIFDPVDGSNAFLENDDACRLINVALSRAQAKVILFISSGDMANPLFRQIVTVIQNASVNTEIREISDFINKADFPQCAIGQRVIIGKHEGEIIGTRNDGKELEFINIRSGMRHFFVIEVLQSKLK